MRVRVYFNVFAYLGLALIAKVDAEGVLYYHGDHLGSPSVVTSSSGQVVETVQFSPFGEVISEIVSRENQSVIGFTGQGWDETLELYDYGARCYDPVLARFMSVDPLREEINPQDLNLYAYAWGNPLRIWDPTGMEEKERESSEKQSYEDFITEHKVPLWIRAYARLLNEPLWILERLSVAVGSSPFLNSRAVRAYENWTKVLPGMSEEQVIEIMGNPQEVTIAPSLDFYDDVTSEDALRYPAKDRYERLHLIRDIYVEGFTTRGLTPRTWEESRAQVFRSGAKGVAIYRFPEKRSFEGPEVIFDRQAGLVLEVRYHEGKPWWIVEDKERREQRMRATILFLMGAQYEGHFKRE